MTELLALTFAILVSGGVGFVSRRHRPRHADAFAARLIGIVLWVVFPPCVFVNVAHFDLASSAGLGLLVGAGCLCAGAAISWVAARALSLPGRSTGALICTSIVANTGYFGLPATLLVLGSGAVTAAAAWDALLTSPITFLVGFAVGAYYGEEGATGPRARLRLFLGRNPVLWVLIPALLTPAAAIPPWALEASHLAFVAMLPVGFYVMGVNLALPTGAGRADAPAAAVAAATAIRLLVVPGLFAVVSLLIGGTPPSFYIEAAAPVGINALIIASLFDLDRRLTAAAIAATTGLALVGVMVAGTLR